MDLQMFGRLQPLVSLSDAECRLIASLGREISIPEHGVIMEQGSVGTSFFILVSGRIEVRQGGVAVSSRKPGAVLGEMSLFNDNVRVAEAVAVQPCTMLEIETADFLPLVLHDEPAAVKLMQSMGRLMSERLQHQDADMLRRIGERDPSISAVARDFAPLKKRLMADWALKYHEAGRGSWRSPAPSRPTTRRTCRSPIPPAWPSLAWPSSKTRTGPTTSPPRAGSSR